MARAHGTRSSYVGGCHCDNCTRANAKYQQRYMSSWGARKVEAGEEPPHGTTRGYRNWRA